MAMTIPNSSIDEGKALLNDKNNNDNALSQEGNKRKRESVGPMKLALKRMLRDERKESGAADNDNLQFGNEGVKKRALSSPSQGKEKEDYVEKQKRKLDVPNDKNRDKGGSSASPSPPPVAPTSGTFKNIKDEPNGNAKVVENNKERSNRLVVPLNEKNTPVYSEPVKRRWIKEWTVVTTMLGNGLCKLMKWVPKEDYDIDNNDMYAPGADLNEQPPLYTSTVTPDKDRQDNVENNQFIKPQKELQPPSRRGSHLSMKKTGQFKCDFEGCGKICFDRASLKKHMQIHGARQYVCTYEGCGKKFQDSSKLKRHYLTHTGEKKHICTICNKAFSLDFNLKTHMRIHTGDKRECPVMGCTKKFIHAYKLKSHLSTHGDLSLVEMKSHIGLDGFPIDDQNFENADNINDSKEKEIDNDDEDVCPIASKAEDESVRANDITVKKPKKRRKDTSTNVTETKERTGDETKLVDAQNDGDD